MRTEQLKIVWNSDIIKKNNQVLSKELDKDNKKAKKSVFKVRVCPSCNTAWERIRTFDVKSTLWSHILDFPKYGLLKEDCPDCD